MYPSLWYHTEQFHCLKSSLCSPCSSLPSPHPLTTTDLFTVSIILPFTECHLIVITQYVAFSDWILSLTQEVPLYLFMFDSAFLFSHEQYSHCLGVPQFICFHLLKDILVATKFGAVMNKAAVNICVQVFVWI